MRRRSDSPGGIGRMRTKIVHCALEHKCTVPIAGSTPSGERELRSEDGQRDGPPNTIIFNHADPRPVTYETIVVPVDGSEHAERAVEHAGALASLFDATLHLITAVDGFDFSADYLQ